MEVAAMRVVCKLEAIRNELGWDDAKLAEKLDADKRTIEKMLRDEDSNPWQLHRDSLYRYLLLAHETGIEAFKIEPNYLWQRFQSRSKNGAIVTIIRGDTGADAPVEDHLSKYLRRLNLRTSATTTFAAIEDSMMNSNCIIIGSPKTNEASEIALARLWGAKPFDNDPQNQARIPIHFLGMTPVSGRPSSLLLDGSSHGFSFQVPGEVKRRFLPVDWLPADQFWPSHEPGQDAALLAVCHRPLGTQQDVTTVVIAGYTGLSTLEAAREATDKSLPTLAAIENPGQPYFSLLRFKFDKQSSRLPREGLRTVKEKTALWGPPWDNRFFGAG
jgi:DNA-binding XRE family transcriptional regulator